MDLPNPPNPLLILNSAISLTGGQSGEGRQEKGTGTAGNHPLHGQEQLCTSCSGGDASGEEACQAGSIPVLQAQPEDMEVADGGGSQGLCCQPESTRAAGGQQHVSSSPSWSVCLQAKAFAEGFTGSLNVCWPEKLPPSMHSLPFPHCPGAITSEGGPRQLKRFWSFPWCTQTFHLLPFLDIALLNEH